ncbi:MAG: AraC family transcriptional regulator [Selenomonadaceae bacterium]|nr:AraC family transcriptional regulator [Selenomonadaceae bacterium]MBR7025926.1 AraC family transcriptional regulator [Selenomonadaceae bacterium]
MAVVYYNREEFPSSSLGEQKIKLLYVCQADSEKTIIPTAMHAHPNHLEIQYISDGKAHIRIGGHSYRVQKGDVIVYNAGVVHEECADPECGMVFYNCGIKNFQSPCLPENHLLAHDIKPVLHAQDMSDIIKIIFHTLFEQISQRKILASYICQHLVSALLLILANQIPHEKIIQRNSCDASFQHCKKFLDEHFTENISVTQMSEIANMSVSGFSHHFKKVLGITPMQYLINLRIGEAQKLLITTDKSITEISMELGYDSVSHFNNQFKKFVGTSPQNYRKLWVGNEQFKNLNHIYNNLMKK